MSPDPVAVDPARLREARVQAHCAAQWLARAARSYLPARDDDGQTNLGWDGATRALTTHPIANRRFALTIAPLALTVGRVAPMALQGLDDAGVRERFGRVVAALGLDASRLDAPPPYEMADDGFASGGRYGGDLDDAFDALARWFDFGARRIEGARAALIGHGLDAPAPRCWPHHFDLATQASFAVGTETAYVGAGFTPGDHYYDEPYFYVSLYPARSIVGLPDLGPVGHWRDEGFTAAVATVSTILATGDKASAVDGFLARATAAAIERLRRPVR